MANTNFNASDVILVIDGQVVASLQSVEVEYAKEEKTEVNIRKIDLDRVVAHTMLGFKGLETPVEMAEKISDSVLNYLVELGVAQPQCPECCEECADLEECERW